jgi:hypothetical protein
LIGSQVLSIVKVKGSKLVIIEPNPSLQYNPNDKISALSLLAEDKLAVVERGEKITILDLTTGSTTPLKRPSTSVASFVCPTIQDEFLVCSASGAYHQSYVLPSCTSLRELRTDTSIRYNCDQVCPNVLAVGTSDGKLSLYSIAPSWVKITQVPRSTTKCPVVEAKPGLLIFPQDNGKGTNQLCLLDWPLHFISVDPNPYGIIRVILKLKGGNVIVADNKGKIVVLLFNEALWLAAFKWLLVGCLDKGSLWYRFPSDILYLVSAKYLYQRTSTYFVPGK